MTEMENAKKTKAPVRSELMQFTGCEGKKSDALAFLTFKTVWPDGDLERETTIRDIVFSKTEL